MLLFIERPKYHRRSIFQECKEYIRKTEEMGYELALVNVGGGRYVLHICIHSCLSRNFVHWHMRKVPTSLQTGRI